MNKNDLLKEQECYYTNTKPIYFMGIGTIPVNTSYKLKDWWMTWAKQKGRLLNWLNTGLLTKVENNMLIDKQIIWVFTEDMVCIKPFINGIQAQQGDVYNTFHKGDKGNIDYWMNFIKSGDVCSYIRHEILMDENIWKLQLENIDNDSLWINEYGTVLTMQIWKRNYHPFKDVLQKMILEGELVQVKQENMEKLEITKDKVLEAASKCPQAKETLQTLFPEVFKKEDWELAVDLESGSILDHAANFKDMCSPLLWGKMSDEGSKYDRFKAAMIVLYNHYCK